jgi:nucleotide-binding universal stress UspA family protein
MLAFPFSEIASEPMIQTVSAKVLRQWCTPQVILVVTNLSDEFVLLPHAISQARLSGAKIVLARSVSPSEAHVVEARIALDRMARQLRWLGIACEPLVLSGHPEAEIPAAVRSYRADRVMVRFEDSPEPTRTHPPVLAQLLSNLDVPTCVIGQKVSLASTSSRLTRNIALAVSLESDCDTALGFSSRLAQELRAKLTLLHVFGRAERDLDQSAHTSMAVASMLPASTLREAELLCPTEINIREGNAEREILKHAISTNQDLILLCSPGISLTGQPWRTSVSWRVLAGAECPVFVLQKKLRTGSVSNTRSESPGKVPAYGERISRVARKEIV